ncbi:MAG: BatD family protein [Deltaproteobacteria bacterium]|nr:BatD family protein [Deltaproteobacteria bacterium]
MSALALPLLVALAAQADGSMMLRYEVTSREVPVGAVFQLDIVLQLDGRGQVEELALPEFTPAFSVVRESRAEVRTGGRQELRFVYALRAEYVGEHRIGEAVARRGKATARAAPITIRVTGDPEHTLDGSDQAGSGPSPGARFGAALPSAFLEVTTDHASAWVGQQILVTTTVYSQQPLAQVPRLPAMKPPGFLCVAFMNDGESITPSQRTLRGRSYYVYVLHKDALFPLDEGSKSIAAVTAEVVPAGSLFSRARSMTVRSAPLSIDVKALPADARPARFAPGNVGRWQIDASARPAAVTVGQAFTLAVTVSGEGALESVQVPSWDGGGKARVFPPSTRIERKDGAPVAGRVVVETLVQPTEPGELRVPSLAFASFDPERGEYVEARTAPLVVKVKGAGAGGTEASVDERQPIAKSARPLKTRPRLGPSVSEAPVVGGAATASVGAVGFLLLRARARRHGSVAGETRRRREQRAKALAQASVRGDLTAVERALFDALAERAGDDVRGLPSGELGGRLTTRGLSPALVERLVAFIRDVEAARYSPSVGSTARRMADEAVTLVRELEGGA